jgi:hypothetical protein
MTTKRFAIAAFAVCLFSILTNDALAFYNPQTGHWLSRDPIEESGGVNVHEFCGNDSVNTIDLFGLLIRCCSPEDYFDNNQLAGKYQKDPNDDKLYMAKPGASGPTGGDGEILWDMLLTKHEFVVKGQTVDNLKLHVAARNTIVKNALNSEVHFGHNPDVMPPSPVRNPDPQAYYNSLNNEKTKLGCNMWSLIIFQTGNKYNRAGTRTRDAIWIPGDWDRINNRNFTRGEWKDGYQGENVFYVGNNLFWGLFYDGKHDPKNQSWWWAKIHDWHDIYGDVQGAAEWDPDMKVTFPGTGLQ